MPRVAIHIKSRKGGLQIIKPCIVITYYKPEDIGTIQRSLNTRGVDYQFEASRECTNEEMKAETHPYRVEFIRYNDWSALIEDENKFTNDSNWFQKLAELKNKYPQFKTEQLSLV